MNIETAEKKPRRVSYGAWAAPVIIGAFFCFLCLYYGVGLYPDSVTYMQANIDREPLYPLLLRAFRAVFGTGLYLTALIWFQNLTAFLVTWYLYAVLAEQFQLNWLFRTGLLLVLLMPHLLSGVLTPSGIILTNAVLSEGITLTLYQFFFVCLWQFWNAESEKRRILYLAASWAATFLAVLARGQMLVMLPVWVVVAFTRTVLTVRGRRLAGRAAAILAAAVAAFLLRSFSISAYDQAMFGYAQGNTGGNLTILTNVLYSSDEQAVDAAAQELDDADAALLREIYRQMRGQTLGVQDSGDGFLTRIWHHEDSHDKIKFDIINVRLHEWAEEAWPEADETLYKIRMDEQAGQFVRVLLPHSAGSFLKTWFLVSCGGFIRTVAVWHPLLNLYALLIYIVAIGLMWYLFRKGKNEAAPWMMAIVLLMTAANVCATSLTIMCLSRYMIYNLSLFYAAGLILVWRCFKIYQKRSKPD